MIILALLCQHFDFDKRRMELPGKAKLEFVMASRDQSDMLFIAPFIFHIFKYRQGRRFGYRGVVSTWVFELCLFFGINDTSSDANTNKTVRMVSLQSLGHLYLSYPTLMVHPESTNFMDRIFDGDSDSMRIELMKVYLQFLAGESERMKLDDMKKENDTVDLRVLIGNAEEFAEAGVSSSLMQRYLNRILSAALDEDRTLRVLAFDVVGNIVRQGLAHPVLCMPTIVAMETSPENSMRDKAYRLHVHLNEKHASLMHTRNVECVSKAYAYQKQVAKGQVVRGYAIRTSESKPEALLNTMYILMRDKRQKRNDFLLQILKTFEFQFKKGSRENVDLDFQRFIADNVATFDYKYLDEVLYGIYVIHRVMSVTGMNLHAFLERRALKTTNGATDEGTVAAVQQNCIASEVGLPGGSEERNKMVKNSESQSGDEGEKEDDDALVLEQDDIQLDLPVAAKLSVSMSILMLLRDHLKRSYTLNEVKCRQYNPNQANAQKDKDKDKPAARNPNISTIISWEEKLPFAEKPITFEADMEATCQRFRTQMAEDGTARDDYGDDSMELMSNNEGGSAFEDFDGLNVNGSVAGPAKTPTNRLRTKTGLMKKLRNTPKKSGVAAKGAKPKGASKARTKKSSVEDGDEEEWRASGALVGRIDFGSGGAGGGSHGTTTPKKRRRSIQLAVVESGSEEEMDPGDDDPDWRG
ncbi:sister chromatid cohesion C-terminus-domain-containing protein [Jimgerdemannia flammicorona]|uniref:Sister chromatid cohesion protein n=1 Tax=Jimgerdemannia flammicorona TaxID=994334 RepID=A0A433QMR5_9FUNG|nr:sister chromatid cohesion C-terminus-domain-containing protein [Jimgerdemannia flammicorona]